MQLPCPLRPGSYAYEIWLMGEGFGATDEGGPRQKLSGRIVVE